MKNVRHKLSILTVFFILSSTWSSLAQLPEPGAVKSVMKKVADWQIGHLDDPRYLRREEPRHPLDWTKAAFYMGMLRWAAMADDDRYYEWMRAIGEEHDWTLYQREPRARPYHADDHAVGQMYLQLYRKYHDSKMIEPTRKHLHWIMDNPPTSVLNWNTKNHQHRWNWCDALFMAPPVWARLSEITGDPVYRNWMFLEFKATTDFLFDQEEHLYYRDESFMGQRPHGRKVFWARGNGWVFAGLCQIMEEIPAGSTQYGYYLDLYQKMAAKLIEIQTEEGHWAMSLLDADHYPTPETSGTAFYTFGLAWGIRNGLLERETYLPPAIKGWKCLVGHVTDEGMLGYVQPIGSKPGQAWPDKAEVYGSGAFLAAGSEIYKLVNDQ